MKSNNYQMTLALLPSRFWKDECDEDFNEFINEFKGITSTEVETNYGQNEFTFEGPREELEKLYYTIHTSYMADPIEDFLQKS